MKNMTLFKVLLLCTILLGDVTSTAMNKRKFKEEKEKEKEVEYTPSEQKKLKISGEVEIDPTQKLPKNIMKQNAQGFINTFLATRNKEEEEKLKNEYKNFAHEMHKYIAQLINKPNPAGNTLLHQARTPQEVGKLFFLGADPLIQNKALQIPLATVTARGNVQAAEAIIDAQRASENDRVDTINLYSDKYHLLTRFTPFHFAIAFNDLPLAEKLVKYVSISTINRPVKNIFNLEGTRPKLPLLGLAAQYSIEAVPLLLRLGANINDPAKYGETPIMILAENPNARPADIDFMVEKGADVNAKDMENSNIIVYAVKGNNDAIIQHLVEKYKLNLNERNNDVDEYDESFKNGRLPIDYAVDELSGEKQMGTIKTLLNLGSELPSNGREILNPEGFVYRDSDGYLRTDLLKLLIELGASINARNNRSYTLANVIFYYYKFSNNTNYVRGEPLNYDLIKFLIENGARITQKDKDFIMAGHYNKLKELVKNAQVFDL